MKKIKMGLFLIFYIMISCTTIEKIIDPINQETVLINKKISYDGISVELVIEKPIKNEVDVLMVFHGTVKYDSLVLQAAQNTLIRFKEILDRKDIMIVSVAYPEENMLFGDNIRQCEAALLWIKNKTHQELGVKVKKVFLGGHSQGGYLVTRLNTMHVTDGVIANAPGPLNLVFRCQLEEDGKIANEIVCNTLSKTYGTTNSNPVAYQERSLLHFTKGFKSDILFVQGLDDSPIQMYSWPLFKQQVVDCKDCKVVTFLEVPSFGHSALFGSIQAKETFNDFIKKRSL